MSIDELAAGGYETGRYKVKVLPQPAVLHQERYRPVAEQQADVATYNEAMAAFYAQQQMKVRGTWAVHSGKRVATPEALTGRDRLKEALQALGFPLK